MASGTSAQQKLVSDEKKRELADNSARLNVLFEANYQKALALAKNHGWPVITKTKNGGLALLQGVNGLGYPVYIITYDNIVAAATTQTNALQPGGNLGLSLSGSSTFLNDKLAIWDGGEVDKTHQEFSGKTVTLEDSQPVADHATHVAGTMIAKGVYPPAKGMAFNAATLHSYYFDNDVSKMTAAASGLLLSNHSYGDEAGWNFNSDQNRWEWYGLPGDTVDYNLGFYGTRTLQYDQIAFNAPYYLIVESAGNAHAYPGPALGQDYYGYQSINNQTIVDKGPRPSTISSNDGYDVISTTGNAKNILTVGAVNPLPNGPASSRDISIASFSSWGPTDDGRIKPDIVADGVNVTSAGSATSSTYITLSGTSMAAPNVTGSLYLLQEYFAQKHNGTFMRAATLKGLACHTAFDAGNAGPDYIYGWGLLDMKKAAQALIDNGSKSLVTETSLPQGQTQTYNVVASGDGPLSATISWTDPAGQATADGVINSRIPKLVNDLDIRISDGSTTFYPWILDPNNPSAAAKAGDNIVDNVEQVFIPGAVPGKAYTITVTHKGSLQGGLQDYSLIVTGSGGQAYCVSGPLSNADSRVNNFSLSSINYTPPAGCTTYSDHTNQTVQLEQGKTYPLSITLGTCGTNFNKAAKIYVDWNGNGVFDANELVATTAVFNGTGVYSTNITVPATVVPGNYSLLRVVLTETSDTSIIKPCGNYEKGETQDYRVQFLQTSIDAGIASIVSPDVTGVCPGNPQITVIIKNYGSKPISNIPVKVIITGPDKTVTTLNQIYSATLQPQEQEAFILNGSFTAVAGAFYTITASTNLGNDLIPANNQVTETVTINTPASITSFSAYYCNNNKNYQLSGLGDGEILWYQNLADTIPFAFGSTVTVAQAPISNNYYAGLNDFKGSIGPATKYVFSGGSYNQFTPYVNLSTRIPMIIQSARLYIGNSGKITFNLANANGQVVSTAVINAVATRTNPAPGSQADDPNDQGAVYPLNLRLPAAGAYTLTAVFDSTATIYRSNTGVTGYPFKIGNIFSIDGNNAVSGTDTAYYKNFYYYFYDLKLQSPGCAAPARQAVSLTQPVISLNGTALTSNFLAGNQWYIDGKAIDGATGQTYIPTKSGNYTVGINLSTGCQLLSDNYVYVLTSNKGSYGDIGLVVYPVPANNQLNVIFASPANNNLNLSLMNAAGLIVYNDMEAIAQGNFSKTIDVSRLAPGTYLLKLALGQKVYYDKIVIVR
ncbi:MAG: S8 family serine peptidase [Mucilaginibacter sp.]|nr:S8 family serine peptidase [Mucilaginibacter sp.]